MAEVVPCPSHLPNGPIGVHYQRAARGIAEANKVVRAKSFFTKRTDGIKHKWHGRVFLNPPFDDWPSWMAKLHEEIKAGRVKQSIVVGPANISAFRPLFKRSGLLFIS